MRIGYGYDVHRLVAGRPLKLGGIQVDHAAGLQGHSDADVLLHAIIDALLGAAALGDIGQLFPDTDEEWRDADSRDLLVRARSRIDEAGFLVVNVDATVIADQPRLAPHLPAMRSLIADVLGVRVDQVSVKATTSEGMGFVGEERGMAAHAVCLLQAR